MEKSGLWIIRLIAISIMVGAALRAVSTPWRWTLDQSLLAFLALFAVAVLGRWAAIWQRKGPEGVKSRWLLMQSRKKAAGPSGKFAWKLVIWTTIAIALALLFKV